MADVWAKNNLGEKRRFTDVSWNLLGKNKEGWELMPDHVIHNVAQKTPMQKPSTGIAKPQKIENVLEKNKAVENFTEPNKNILKEENSVVKENLTTEIQDEKKSEFLKAANGIKSADIKDFFDRKEIDVDYKAGDKYTTLLEKLGEKLNFDILELQTIFGK